MLTHQPGPDDDVPGPSAVWPLAVLLGDDRAAAEELVSDALAGRGSPTRAVVNAALRIPDDAPRPAPPPPAPGPPTSTGALAAALRALPRRTRTLAVAGLLDPPAARAVADTAEVDRAVAALRSELAHQDERQRAERGHYEALFRPPGSPAPASGPDRTPLPDRLRALAARTPLDRDGAAELVRDSGARRRSRRRTRLQVLAAVLVAGVVAAVAVLVPRPVDPSAPAPAPGVDVYAGSPRGSLSADPVFLEALRARTWSATDLATDPPPTDHRVVWAGEVDAGRAALLVSGEGTPDFAVAWFAGPPRATAGQLRLQAVHLDPDPAVPVALTAPVSGALVVVGAPGDRVQVSARAVLGADGTASRTYSPADTERGVATVALPRSTPGAHPAVRYKVLRDGRQLDTAPPDVVAEPDPGPAQLPGLRPAPVPSPADATLDERRRDLLSRLGQRADSSGTTVLWSGDVPAGDGRPTRVGVVAVPQPAGSVVVAALHGRDDGTAGTCAPGALPSAPPPDQLVVALPCDLGGPSSRLLVVGPPGDDVLRLLDADGVLLEQRPMDDGFAVVAVVARLATVQVRTADGRTLLARTPVPLELGD